MSAFYCGALPGGGGLWGDKKQLGVVLLPHVVCIYIHPDRVIIGEFIT